MVDSVDMGNLKQVSSVSRFALRDRLARTGRPRLPEPMLVDDPEAVRAFHESAATAQLPAYEFNAARMSRLAPRHGLVLDLGSGQLAAHPATGRPDVSITCVDFRRTWSQPIEIKAAERDVGGRLSFVTGDITRLEEELIGTPDPVCCKGVVHLFPDRDTPVAALREIAPIRDQHGSAVWIFDLGRLRRPETMPTLLETMWRPDSRLQKVALASEAAAVLVASKPSPYGALALGATLTLFRGRHLGGSEGREHVKPPTRIAGTQAPRTRHDQRVDTAL